MSEKKDVILLNNDNENSTVDKKNNNQNSNMISLDIDNKIKDGVDQSHQQSVDFPVITGMDESNVNDYTVPEVVDSNKNDFVSPVKFDNKIDSSNAPHRQLRASYQQQIDFLNKIKQGCLDGWTQYRVLPSLTASQCAFESGWGQHAIGNNILGIKGNDVHAWTQEWINGHYETLYLGFKAYPSVEACIQDHNTLLGEGSRYANIRGVRDYRVATALVRQDGYATDPTYPQSLRRIIEEHDLTSWDQEAFNGGWPKKAINTSAIKIQYVPGYGVLGFHRDGSTVSNSNSVLLDGTSWATAGTAVINGQEMFKIATDEYVPLQFTTVGSNKTITINYNSGYGVLGYRIDGSSVQGSNSVFITGTSWVIDHAAMINGEIMYEVATNEYVPKRYTQYGNGK